MKGFIELTWLTYLYPLKPRPAREDYPNDATHNNAVHLWAMNMEDRSATPRIARSVSLIDVRDIREVGGSGFQGTGINTGCQVVRHSHPDCPTTDVEESYEEVKRRIAEAKGSHSPAPSTLMLEVVALLESYRDAAGRNDVGSLVLWDDADENLLNRCKARL